MDQNRTQYSLRRLKAPITCEEASLEINNELSVELTIQKR